MSLTPSQQDAARAQLAAGGRMKMGVVFAPSASNFFTVKDADGQPRGVTVDLAAELAGSLGVPVDFVVVPNSGLLADALEKQEIDVAFMPEDEERRQRVDFGPSYFLLESTGLVRGDSPVRSIADLNHASLTVVGIANTTTIRGTARALPSATIVPATSVGEAMDMLRDGRADAVSLSRDVLQTYQAKIAGSRILDGRLHSAGIAIAVPKGRPAALACVTDFLESAKSSGLVRQIFDRGGFHADQVAPPHTAA